MKREEINALKEVANSKIVDILDALNVEYNERYQYLYGPCMIHDGEKSDGWSWHLELGMYQCYTRSCHEHYGKDVFGLVKGIKKCNFFESIKFVKQFCSGEELKVKEITERKENKRFINKIKKEERKNIVYPEESLSRLEYHDYLESRGFEREIIEKFQVGLGRTPYKRMYNRIVFPIRDIDGRIVGFTGRNITEDGPKWIHSYDFDKSSNLYNIHNAKDFIKDSGIAILVEGPIDVLRLEQANVRNGVAVLGRSLTNGQMSLLIKAGASKLIFAFDSDNAGRTGIAQGIKMVSAFFDVDVINLPEGKDVGDLSKEQIGEIFNEKVSN